MNLAIIPARGGSKRIPRKNIREFCGKPMIAWAIEAALASGCFDHVIVSTDDRDVAEAARSSGAEVPFVRPAELANDHATTIPVIAHAIDCLGKRLGGVDRACCVYATAPFVTAESLREGLRLLVESGADYVFTVTSYAFPIQRAIRMRQDGGVEMFQPQYANTRSQDLEEAWHDAGQFYWGTAAAWCHGRPIFAPHSRALVLPRYAVQDIDTPEDWTRAEYLFKQLSAARTEADDQR